jgi:ureidoglycolate lyase
MGGAKAPNIFFKDGIMIEIKAKPLTKEAFQKYGDFLDLTCNDKIKERSFNPAGFWPDLIQLDFHGALPPTVAVCQATKVPEIVVAFTEAHEKTSEGLLPIDGDVVIYVGPPPMRFGPGPAQFRLDALEAFIVPKGTFVKLNPMTTHGSQFAISQDEVHVLCLLPGKTYATDMLAAFEQDDAKKVKIVL